MEPLTAFSLCVTILGIVLTTINNIEQKTDEIINCKDILSDIQLIFDECSATLMLWNATWAREEMTEGAYQELFSAKGWEQIKEAKQLVENSLGEVHQSLCLTNKTVLPEEDVTSRATSRFSSFTSKLTRPGAKLIKKARALSLGHFGIKSKQPELGANDGILPEATLTDVPERLSLWEYQEWVRFTYSLSKPQSRPKPSPSIIRRISGILIVNQRLNRKVERMKEGVNKLNKLVKIYSEGRGNEDVQLFLDQYDFSLFARNFSQQILQFDNRPPNLGWYLQLNFPDEEKDCKAILEEIVTQCKFCFATYTPCGNEKNEIFQKEVKVLPVGGTLRPNREIKIFLRQTIDELFTSEEKEGFVEFLEGRAYQLKAFAEPALWTNDWRTLLAVGVYTPLVRKAFELELARLALGFTMWMILLWQDDWFSHICSCSLRCVFFPQEQNLSGRGAEEGQKQYRQENLYFPAKRDGGGAEEATREDETAAAVENANSPQAQPAAAHEAAASQICTRQCAPIKKLHLFGILLAELLLAQPIELDADLRPTGGFTEPTQICWCINKMVSANMASAVHFCFNNAGKSRWDPTRGELANKQRVELVKNVLMPVKKHYESVRNHCGAQPEHVDQIFDVARDHEDSNFA